MPLPKIRNSEAFSTEGKEEFNHMVEFVFDYSDLDMKSRQVKKEFSDFSYEVKKLLSEYGLGKASQREFIDAKFAGEMMEGGLGKVGNTISLLPDGIQTRLALKQAAQQIGADGKQTMLGYATRRLTGLMRSAISYSTRGTTKRTVIQIGWLRTWFKYFAWQEEGTDKIAPMNSIGRTYLTMLPRVLNYTSRFIRSYTRGTGNETSGKAVDF